MCPSNLRIKGVRLYSVTELESKARWLRREILEMCAKAGTGHVSSAFSCVEIAVSLYYGGILHFDSQNPDGRDRFIISKGQSGIVVYPILADLGFFPKDELTKFCQSDGILGVHASKNIPGIEATTGSLGHGLGLGTGMALAAKMDSKLYMTFVLLGDGECYEGSVWEQAMFAAHHHLNNLVAIIDRNNLCTTDFTENIVALEPLREKWLSFGWSTMYIDGHSFTEILAALQVCRERRTSRPQVIIANTVKGKGVSFMENVPLWHAVCPTGEQLEQARRELENYGKP
jgi:transketolase